MSVRENLERKKELKIEILKTLTHMNCLLSEIGKQIKALQNEAKPSGRLAVGEEKVMESFQPVLVAFGGEEDPFGTYSEIEGN